MGGGVAAIAVVLGVTLSGVLTPSVDGTAVPDEPTRVLSDVGAAGRSLAKAPSAVFNGTVTIGDRDTLRLENLTVTATGETTGTVIPKQGRAELLQVGDSTFVKADDEFWKAQPTVLPGSVTDVTETAGKWTAVPRDVFGIDLGAVLLPTRLGLSVDQQDVRYGDAYIGEESSDDPNQRNSPSQDPVGVMRLDVGEDDGGVTGDRRYQAGEMTIGVDSDGDLVSVRGPLAASTRAVAAASGDLTVAIKNADDTRSTYDAMTSTVGDLRDVPLGFIAVTDPKGDLNCAFGGDCVLDYTMANTVRGALSGEIAVTITSEFKVDGAPLGTCRGTGRMPAGGRGTVTCRIATRGREGSVDSTARFTVSGRADVDTGALSTAVRARAAAVRDSLGWESTTPKASAAARRYDAQITRAPSGYVLRVGDVAFDGRESDGTLLLVYGPGYGERVLPDGGFAASWSGTGKLLAQARDARAAAADEPVRMVFAEQPAADAARRLLAENGVEGVDVVDVPAV
ncbi:hypothetical protein GCM10023197_11640 [Gordonia humi]